MNPLLWVVALLVVGLAVMLLEVFVPSGGVLGFLSVLAIGAAIVMAFLEAGPTVGLGVIAVTFMAVPAVLALAFRWFPETPLGRRVLPPPPAPDEVQPAADHRRRLHGLVGRTGRVTRELVPWGEALIDGSGCDALSESGPIAAGVEVEAVRVEGRGLVVRPLPPRAPAAEPPSSPSQPAQAGPLLSQTLEEFDFDRLEPPAA